ncbi:TDT family transporter [Actinoplanes sp. NPDC024001]|uniref:TDT family transporter n=1 Tax=Actinoplanes sp. NPDC024001 TaxID=3154598 RepID=UPI003405801C
MSRHLAPNWFTAVMGTGIVATAAVSLPVSGLRPFATAFWLLAATLLAVLGTALVRQWRHHPRIARAHLADPVMAGFYGALAMALLTVGTGALLLGPDGFGVAVAWVLWTAGTVCGLVTTVAVPYLRFTRPGSDRPAPTWLIPVVPPMVSAAGGALLVPHTPAGEPRLALLLACYAMFGISLIAALVLITQIWQELTTGTAGPNRAVPTLWIVLGPLGQAVTAANLLGAAATHALPAPHAGALAAFGVVLGVPLWGFALLWACLAAAVTWRAVRAHLPFSPAWWSFTFPVGTCVTGTSALAAQTGSATLRVLAVALYAVLVTAWSIVAARSLAALCRHRASEIDVLDSRRVSVNTLET